MAGDDAVAGDDLLVHPEVAAAVRDELVDFLERAGVEQQIDALARGQLAGGVLLVEPVLPAAELRAALQVGERRRRIRSQAFTVCAFSQSFRNFSRPMLVSGWLKSASITAGGHVAMSAPIFAASTT